MKLTIFLIPMITISLSQALLNNVCAQDLMKDEILTDKKEIGRLFSQLNERKHLDALRKNNRLSAPQHSTKSLTAEPEKSVLLPQPVTLQGYVKRSDGGKSTVWINHQPMLENSQVNGVNVGKLTQHRETAYGKKSSKNIELLEINIPALGKHVQLKAGQKYEPETNRIKEVTTVAKENQVLLESADVDDINYD